MSWSTRIDRQIARLKAIKEKASPGPWHSEKEPDEDGLCAVLVGERDTTGEYMIGGFQNTSHRNEVADAALATLGPLAVDAIEKLWAGHHVDAGEGMYACQRGKTCSTCRVLRQFVEQGEAQEGQ